jgi:hypothetical protein
MESVQADGDRPTDKEVIQVVEYRKESGDRGVEGGDGCEDGPEVPEGAANAKRNEGRTALADA